MSLFSSRRRTRPATTTTTRRTRFRNPLRRRDPDRVAGGFKAALSNPNTTRDGRKQAKRQLRRMGRGNETHVPLMTKIKRSLGIRSTPRHTTTRTRRTGWFSRDRRV